MLLRDEPRLQAILPQGAILCGEEPVEVYLAADYDRLEQECANLREERDSFQRVGIRTMEERDAALKQVEILKAELPNDRS